MRLSEALVTFAGFSAPTVPNLGKIKTAVQRVNERWPDVEVPLDSREREALAIRLRDRVAKDDWHDTRLSFVLAAAQAVFDQDRRNRSDLLHAREFLYEETKASRSPTFLSGMLLTVYLECFEPNALHTRSLAEALVASRVRLSPSRQQLLSDISELLDATDGPRRLANRLTRVANPFGELTRLGLRSPHGPGFMDHVHKILSFMVRDVNGCEEWLKSGAE